MVVNMLKAVSKMLERPGDMDIKEGCARVDCAKTMLDEIIKGLESKDAPTIATPFFEPLVPKHETPKSLPESPLKNPIPPPPKEEPEYMISVTDDKKLKLIRGFPLDGEVKLDGKLMKHKQAIGMTFQKIQVLV